MAKTYCSISLTEMEAFLETKGFHQVNVPNCQELVWEKTSKVDGRLALRVYSSLTGSISRGCGEDAIRIVIWDYTIDRPVTGSIRTNRVAGWQGRMLVKLKELAASFRFVKCPDCGAYMMERESHSGNKFLGCSRFPACKHTERA